jgi:hypothetical protein
MMTDKQLIARLLELQEHPEQMTDEQLRQMLNDEQMHELVEQMAFTKRAFKNEESLIGELPIADEWEKFATAHAEELTNSARAEGKFTLHFPTHKIAASFIGVVLASSIALAAIHIVRQYQKPETPQTTDTIAVASPQRSILNAQPEEADTLAVEPRIFDNVPLDTMLLEMADYYHISVEFEREEARQLRFHFIWKRTDNLDRLVEKLNNFEAVNIIREPEKLIVK